MSTPVALAPAKAQALLAIAECQRAEGRRLYAGQYETSAKALNSLVEAKLADAELANDKRLTYGLTEFGQEIAGRLEAGA